jgi:hypothetical protein
MPATHRFLRREHSIVAEQVSTSRLEFINASE